MDTRNFDRDQERDDLGQNENRTQRTDRDREQSGDYHGNIDEISDSSFSNQDWQSQWPDIESDYRKRYPSLTEDDVDYSDGDFDSMSDRIAKRTNRNYQDVQNEIRNWTSSNPNAFGGRNHDEEDADFDRIPRK